MNAPAVLRTAPLRVTTAPMSKWLDQHPALGISMMDHLFNRLDGAFPHRWRSAFSNAQAVENWRESWAEAFEAERLTTDEVKSGLDAVRRRGGEWPPSLPEFIKACRPAVDAAASFDFAVAGAYARARGETGNWPHPAIYWAYVEIGAYDLLHKPQAAIRGRWQAVLAEQMARGAWPAIPAPMLALPPVGQSVTDKETAKRRIKEIGLLIRRVDRVAND